MAKLTASQEHELHDAFDLFDSDHSGTISRKELKQVLQALNIRPSESELHKVLTLMDTDNSGDIDFNEFKKVMAQSFFRSYSREELLGAFNRFDTDRNGYITTRELHTVVSNLGRRLNQKEVESMIKSIDKDGDGKLSFNEFCKLFD